MFGFSLIQMLSQLSPIHLVWAGLVILTVFLLAMIRTAWKQSQPLRKCVLLSFLAHLLLGVYSTTVPMVDASRALTFDEPLRISDVQEAPEESENDSATSATETLADDPPPEQPSPVEPTPDVPADNNAPPAPQPQSESEPASLIALREALAEFKTAAAGAREMEFSPDDEGSETEIPASFAEAADLRPQPEPTPRDLEITEVPSPPLVERVSFNSNDAARELESNIADSDVRPASRPETIKPLGSTASSRTPADGNLVSPSPQVRRTETSQASSAVPPAAAMARMSPARSEMKPPLPPIYQLRMLPNRERVLEHQGGSEQTEAAVRAALKWLAENQSADGRWDARKHGGGRELLVFGRDRAGAGARADTGVTGSALLAFLGAGHTHREGEYQAVVMRGIEYLASVQGEDGNLAGDAEVFAFMYCHGMASFALSECYAMSGDPALAPAVQKAVDFILRGQHSSSGGWRYKPGDRGDTSVFGWQLMALKSAELAGIPIPRESKQGMIQYLKSVSGGRHGGLAGYRPGELESRTMTAESLVCRQFLGMTRENPASDEAGDYILGQVPGMEKANYYYWYYATLAAYQLGGRHWTVWNNALSRTLVDSQHTSGPHAGSWEPNDVWGGYGGRVYSTATAALCLEVYYRFLPLYAEVKTDAAGRK